MPERLRVPGLLNAERWIDAKNPKVAVATYDLETVGVLRSAPNSSPWTKRTAKFRKGLMRYEGEQLFPGDKVAPKDAVALLIAMNVAPEHEAEFNESVTTPSTSRRSVASRAHCQPDAIAAPARRSDIPRALPSRLVGSAVFKRVEGGSEHPVDRAHAAALSGPSSLRMPALHAGRLDRSGVKRGF